MISVQYFATAQDIIDAYGNHIPSNVVCIAGNNDSILINAGNNNPHTDEEEQGKTTVVDKIKNQNKTVDPTEETIILKNDDGYTGLGTVTITGIQASRLVEYITENGVYNYTPEEGHYYTGVELEVNVQPSLQNKEVTPTRQDQTIGADEGHYGLNSVVVKAVTSAIDPDITAGNIRKGVEILGVYGTYEPIVDNITITPSTESQTHVAPTGVDGYDKIFVSPVTAAIDSNIAAGNIKKDVNILGVVGTLESGSGTSAPSQWTGSVDEAGLRGIGWTDDDIANLKANVRWYDWQNDDFKVTDYDKAVTKTNTYERDANLRVMPKFDYSSSTNMYCMYSRCSSLVSIPQLDTSKVTSMTNMFTGCTGLVSIPQLNTSNVTNMMNMFTSCASLVSIPQLDTSKVTSMLSMFAGCTGLVSIPQLNTSNVTNMNSMFNQCSSLIAIPQLDTSKVTNMNSMFYDCEHLTSIPQLDTSKVTNMNSMFYQCYKLTSIPHLDTSSVTDVSSMFYRCDNLSSAEVDFSSVNTPITRLLGVSNMANLTRFILNGSLNVSANDAYSFKKATRIDYDSVKSILEAMNRTTNINAKTIVFDRVMQDQGIELATLVSACTSKGWTITGLTIEEDPDYVPAGDHYITVYDTDENVVESITEPAESEGLQYWIDSDATYFNVDTGDPNETFEFSQAEAYRDEAEDGSLDMDGYANLFIMASPNETGDPRSTTITIYGYADETSWENGSNPICQISIPYTQLAGEGGEPAGE